MKNRTPFVLAASAIVTLAGCAPVIGSVPTDPAARGAEAPRSSASVKLYIGDAPQCMYEQVAFIEGNSRFGSVSETLEMMRTEAASYDADALVVVSHGDGAGKHGGGAAYHGYTGIAVAFPDGTCVVPPPATEGQPPIAASASVSAS